MMVRENTPSEHTLPDAPASLRRIRQVFKIMGRRESSIPRRLTLATEPPSRYFPFFILPLTISDDDLAWFKERNGLSDPMPLEDITDVCKSYRVSATLLDEQGAECGRAFPNGMWELHSSADRAERRAERLLEVAIETGRRWAEHLFMLYNEPCETAFSTFANPTEAWGLAPGATLEEKAEHTATVLAVAENRWRALQGETLLAEMRKGTEP